MGPGRVAAARWSARSLGRNIVDVPGGRVAGAKSPTRPPCRWYEPLFSPISFKPNGYTGPILSKQAFAHRQGGRAGVGR